MPGDGRNLDGVQPALEEPRRCFMPQVVEA
jgi:hypothetical protein